MSTEQLDQKLIRGYEIKPGADLLRADLSGADLSGANLTRANLFRANLTGANLTSADLTRADLYGANLYDANLTRANLSSANLTGADLSGANLTKADLTRANLTRVNLTRANLFRADLTGANLTGADLSGADLTGADLTWVNLSGAKNLLNPEDWVNAHLERDPEGRGFIVYKTFSSNYPVPPTWKIKPGSVITEVVNPLPTVDCACGVNVATLDWVKRHGEDWAIWRGLIRWEWLPGVVVPYNTDGKFRCSKLELLGIVE
jgi:hypothetical protein